MSGKRKISETTKRALEAAKEEARKHILKRQFVNFRTDEQMMDLLLKVAHHKRQPMGVMAREWIEQKLAEEVKLLPLPEIKLPSGEVLTEKSPQWLIEKSVFDHQNGIIKLNEKEYRTLMDWLLDCHVAAKYRKRA